MSTATLHDSQADLTHPWAINLRIPLIPTPYPDWSYEIALTVPSPDQLRSNGAPLWNAVWPGDDEAEVIGAAINFRREFYTETHRAKMLREPLDVDGTVNTFILIKQADTPHSRAGWRHRAASWQSPLFSPAPTETTGRHYTPDAAGLVQMLAESVFGSLELDENFKPTGRRVPSPAFKDFMERHPDLFGEYMRSVAQ